MGCGIFGIYSANQVSNKIYDGLLALQHRGQESAGIATCNEEKISVHKGMGVVSAVFTKQILSELSGNIGIGHVRYSTTGASSIENAQPFFLSTQKMDIAVAMNGNITNYKEKKKELQEIGHPFTTTTDTELIAHLFAIEIGKTDNIFDVIKNIMNQLKGSYSLIILSNKGWLACVRDPNGFKPLCIGNKSEDWFIASETCALDAFGAITIKEVSPGEAVIVSKIGGEVRSEGKRLFTQNRHAHCMFEYVYFARGDSVFESIPIYKVRERLGRTLARLYPVDADVVVPIPDSGRSAAHGYSHESGIPMGEGLMKNRYIFRTFILPSTDQREYAVKLKLNPVREIINGKKVVLVDDSIVRGTTIKKIVKLLKERGAKEVHLRISCPPIVSPCYMGIDFPTHRELIAANHSIEEIKNIIGADSIGYMNIDGLKESIGLGEGELCLACLTGEGYV